MGIGFVFKHQEGAVTGQEVPGLLQTPQLQTVGLLQLDGETPEEAQRTSEAALAQQEVRQKGESFTFIGNFSDTTSRI